MLVSSMVIKWGPAIVPEVGSHIDWFRAKGQLLKAGNIVAILPEVVFTIEAGPGATRPSEWIPWTFEQVVDADTLVLELYDAEYEHSIVVNDVSFDLLDARHGEWVTYSLVLPLTLESPINQVGNTLVTVAVVMGMIGIMSRGMA